MKNTIEFSALDYWRWSFMLGISKCCQRKINFINNKVKITQTWEHNKQEQANYIQANEDRYTKASNWHATPTILINLRVSWPRKQLHNLHLFDMQQNIHYLFNLTVNTHAVQMHSANSFYHQQNNMIEKLSLICKRSYIKQVPKNLRAQYIQWNDEETY